VLWKKTYNPVPAARFFLSAAENFAANRRSTYVVRGRASFSLCPGQNRSHPLDLLLFLPYLASLVLPVSSHLLPWPPMCSLGIQSSLPPPPGSHPRPGPPHVRTQLDSVPSWIWALSPIFFPLPVSWIWDFKPPAPFSFPGPSSSPLDGRGKYQEAVVSARRALGVHRAHKPRHLLSVMPFTFSNGGLCTNHRSFRPCFASAVFAGVLLPRWFRSSPLADSRLNDVRLAVGRPVFFFRSNLFEFHLGNYHRTSAPAWVSAVSPGANAAVFKK